MLCVGVTQILILFTRGHVFSTIGEHLERIDS